MSRLLTLVVFLLSTPALAYDFPTLVESHIQPTYRTLVDETATLDATASTYCSAPSQQGLQDLKVIYREAFLAWQGAQHLRFGPIKYLNREHRYAMWPDKRGTVGKHLGRLRTDPTLNNKDFDISKKSVAVQGFSALERLLFADTPPDDTGCRIITAIASNLATMSQTLYDNWFVGQEAYVNHILSPGPKNLLYVDDKAVAAELLNSLYTELELIEMQKLGNPMGSGPERGRGKRAEAWRSQLATASIQANLEASQALYRSAFAPALQDDETRRSLDTQIDQAFTAALETAAQQDQPLAEAIMNPEGYAWATQLRDAVAATKALVTRHLAQTLALPIGFNSLDGD